MLNIISIVVITVPIQCNFINFAINNLNNIIKRHNILNEE